MPSIFLLALPIHLHFKAVNSSHLSTARRIDVPWEVKREFISIAHLPAITKCFLCVPLMCGALCCIDPCKLPAGWIMTASLRWMPAPCCDAGLWCVCRLGMTEWLFIISADWSNSPAGLPRSRSQFLSLFARTLLAMIMNTNLSSDCVRLCLSVLLKIAEALCQSSTVSWNVSNRLFKNCFLCSRSLKSDPLFVLALSLSYAFMWCSVTMKPCYECLLFSGFALTVCAKLKWWLQF